MNRAVRCLNAEQLERLAAAPDDTAHATLLAHTQACEACRGKLELAKADATLVVDLQELRDQREQIKPVQDEMTDTDGRIVAPPQHPV